MSNESQSTRNIIGNQKGELKDFLITISKRDANDPNVNIFAGVRWLFYKKTLASNQLKRDATWMEAIAEYKGIRKQLGKVKEADGIMVNVKSYYERLKK